jgi:LuxR family maltose regulon positive regulatory protein
MIIDAPPRILATKILPPRSAPGLIDRPRLLDLINQVQTKRLTVIKAAAGFGKTCLAAAWAERLEQSANSVAWLSIDDDDDEPSRFLFNVAQVLQKVCAGAGEPALDLIHEIFLLRPQTIVSTMINNLADVDDEVYLFFGRLSVGHASGHTRLYVVPFTQCSAEFPPGYHDAVGTFLAPGTIAGTE